MNILVVTETYPPEINGVARTLGQIVHGLADLGHRVTVVRPGHRQRTADASRAGVEEYDVRGLPLPGYPGLQFGTPARRLFDRLLAASDIDAAYIATEGPLGYSALRACRRHGVPALSGMHTNFHQYSRHYGAGLIAPLLLGYLRRFHNRVAGTLVPTSAMAGEMRDAGFERLHVWPRGVHADVFHPGRRSRALRQTWGLGDDDIGVIYVGRIAAEKNIETAFDAFAAIARDHPSARFVLVGDGPLTGSLRRVHADAIFVGAKTGSALAEHYASGDMFLFPSKTETFGNVTLEAMASGLAVVSYDLAAAHELIRPGHNGLLAAAETRAAFVAAARRCADRPVLRAQLKRHARESALQQAWPRLVSELEGLFLAVCRETGSHGIEDAAESAERP
ncbi:MAG: glycosyltransferase family 1 protein [Gammaproteobacteria bacterium]|nr:glycosyltransferase family 1 protein [Gammaproteobacteria bacterium]